MSESPRLGFNATVHGARGLFALMVFIYHVVHSGLSGFVPAGAPFEHYFLNSFKFGVELFFGISGFVVIGALARAPTIRSFLWDRATRIYPLLWITLIAITLVSLVVGRWLPPLSDWFLNFLAPPPIVPLPQLNPAAWSLGYEVSFYALCALCWAIRQRGSRLWLPLAVIAGTAALIWFPRAILMPAGVVIAAGLAGAPLLRRLSAFPLLALIGFLLAWRWLDLAAAGDIMLLTPSAKPLAEWFALAPLIVAAGLLGSLALLGIVDGRGLLGRLLRTAPLQWLGTISYSFYLWHPVIMSPVKQVLGSVGVFAAVGDAAQLLFLIVALPPALAVAHYSQLLVEVRLTRWLREFGSRGRRAQAPLTARVGPAGPEPR